jgi:hypothetical protein
MELRFFERRRIVVSAVEPERCIAEGRIDESAVVRRR